MLFTNLTPASSHRRFAGRFASLALAALLAGTTASAQSSNPAPGTSPIQQPSGSSTSTSQQTGNAAPGTAPITTHTTAAALAPGKGPSYENRWDIYGGLAFLNGQAGQNLPKRFNMGGGEAQFTYWLTHKLGVAADYRFGAGTTPVNAVGAQSPVNFNRVLVMEHIFAGGVQYRGPRNRYVAINYHAFAGGDYGIFDYAVTHYPGVSTIAACPIEQPGQHGNLGLYCNHVAPWGAVGGSIDFNQGAKFAVRLAPDLTFEHFGTELREYFGISLGLVYRGHRQ
jgi:hypothetical protein